MPRASARPVWEMLDEHEYVHRFRIFWERLWRDERPEAIERRLSVEGKRPTLEEVSDLTKLWQMLSLRLHGRGASSNRMSQHISWGEFQLAFGASWHAMVIKRIFDIIDGDGDGQISFEDFARGLFPMVSKKASQDDKLHFLFQCLDLDGSSAISREDLLVHLHMYAGTSLLREDCEFSPEQLEGVITATFAEAELDDNGHIDGTGFAKLLRSQPRLLRQLEERLCLNVNKTMANLIIGLDESWLEIGARPNRSHDRSLASIASSSAGTSSSSAFSTVPGMTFCEACAQQQWLRRCCQCFRAPTPRERRRTWDCCFRHVRWRWRERQEYVPTLVVIVP